MSNQIVHCLILCIVSLVAYSNMFDVPFLYDDFRIIIDNPSIRDLSVVHKLSLRRYIGYVTFALNYKVHGFSVIGFHVVNVIIHVLNGILVYVLIDALFRTDIFRNALIRPFARDIAFFSGIIFVVHPLQTQAVTYIVQRFASLAALFYVLSIVMYIKFRIAWEGAGPGSEGSGEKQRAFPARGAIFYGVSIIAAVLAMKTKENAFTLPLMIGIIEIICFREKLKRRTVYLLPLFVTMLIIPLSLMHIDKPLGDIIGDVDTVTRAVSEITRWEYFITEIRVIVTYMRLMLLPLEQVFDYAYPVYKNFFDPSIIVSLLLISFIIGAACYVIARKVFKKSNDTTEDSSLAFVSLGIIWFFLALSVESSVIPISDVMVEHRLYLPSIGFIFSVVSLCYFLLIKYRGPKTGHAHSVRALFISIVIVLSIGTYARNEVYRDELTLWQDVVKKAPNNARAHNNIGLVYKKRGMYIEAKAHMEEAMKLLPGVAQFHLNLGSIYDAIGQSDLALLQYNEALKLEPSYAEVYNNIGKIYESKRLPDQALQYYQKALNLNPNLYGTYINIGNVYGLRDKMSEAVGFYEGAIVLEPDRPEAYVNIGILHKRSGRLHKALEYYDKAIELGSDNAYVYFNAGNAYMVAGDLSRAIYLFERAIAIQPGDPKIRMNLGIAYNAIGRHDDARKEHDALMTMDPHYADILKGEMDKVR